MEQHRGQSLVLRYSEVTEMLNLSESTIRRMVRNGQFPRSFSMGSRAVAFDRAEVMSWMRDRKCVRPL